MSTKKPGSKFYVRPKGCVLEWCLALRNHAVTVIYKFVDPVADGCFREGCSKSSVCRGQIHVGRAPAFQKSDSTLRI